MDVQQVGPYRLDSLIGAGGMGDVYRAYDLRRDRIVALKLLPEALAKDPEYQNRFRRESHVAARLREPHVIPIHDYGEIDGRLFIDMRLVDGETIRDLLAENGAMPPESAVLIVGQVAEALDAAHADGLVHRDIKPSNVLVTSGGFVYVVDFGIARSIGSARSSLTITGVTVGTLDYMAPERFTNQPIDGRTDVYSLACLLYECLTGVQPFAGEDLPALMYAHLYTEVTRPSAVAGVPAAFDGVVARGMAKSANDRYPTPGALADAARLALSATPADGHATAGTPESGSETVAIALPAAPPNSSGQPVHSVGAAPSPSSGSPPHQARFGWSPQPPAGSPPPPLKPPLPAPAAGPPRPPAKSGGRLRVILAVVVAVALLGGLVAAVVALRGLGDGSSASPAANPQAVVAPPQVQVAASVAVPTVSGTISGGTTPGYLEVAPNGRYAYIANRDAGVVSVLDMVINKVTATIPIAAGPPQFVTFAPDGTRAYVSIYNTDRTVALIGVLDTRTNSVLATIPVGRRPFASAINPDGTRLYVPSHDEGQLYVVDTTNNSVIDKIPVAPNPHWVAFARSGQRIYTANHESNVVSVLDASNNAVLTTIPVGTSPHSMVVSPDGSRVSVVCYDGNSVSIIDTATNTVVASVPVGAKPQDVAYAPDGRYLYTANFDGDSVSVIDTATNQVTATIPVTDGPTSIGVTPDGRRAYVTALNSNSIIILDISAS